MKLKRLFTWALLTGLFLLATLPAAAQEAGQQEEEQYVDTVFHDNIDRTADDFVTASVVIASPGEEIYSSAGHACLRLECPTYDLDYIYSYEAENVSHNILRFFAGKLMMGTRSIPTSEYLAEYAKEGRGVVAYKLNLPATVKQRLWQQMDEEKLSVSVPYDFLNHSCSVSVLSWLQRAIDTDSLDLGKWPEKYKLTRKELAAAGIKDPWVWAIARTFVAGESDDPGVSPTSKVIIPAELEELLHRAKAYGKPLVAGKPQTLVEPTREIRYTWFTPLLASLLILAVAVANLFLHWRTPRILVLGLGTLIGLFVWYLVCLSNLTATQWNWLVIPFCPFLLLLWRWRRYWLLPYAGICVAWIIGLLIYPHMVVDVSHLILVLATAITYFEIYKKTI